MKKMSIEKEKIFYDYLNNMEFYVAEWNLKVQPEMMKVFTLRKEIQKLDIELSKSKNLVNRIKMNILYDLQVGNEVSHSDYEDLNKILDVVKDVELRLIDLNKKHTFYIDLVNEEWGEF